MLDPRGGVRGEIRIFGENVFGFDIFLQLHQEAIAADEDVQREIWLHLVELLDREEAFAKGRHPEVDERRFQPAMA